LLLCGFNTSVSAREGRRQDEALPEDEVEGANSSWFNGKECYTVRQRGNDGWRRGYSREEKGGNDASWADMNFTGLKNEENPHDQFRCFKWIIKI
jgi:hypothetical protein